MNIAEKLFNLMKRQDKEQSAKWLARKVKAKPKEAQNALCELENAGRIYRTENGGYRAINEKYVYNGKAVITTGGRAYVWLPDGREVPLEMLRRIAFTGENIKVFLPKSEPQTALLTATPEKFPNGENKLEIEAVVSEVDRPPLYRTGDEKKIRYLLHPMGSLRKMFRCELHGVETELEKGDVVRVEISNRPMYGEVTRCKLICLHENAAEDLSIFTEALEARYGLARAGSALDERQRAMLAELNQQGMDEKSRHDCRNKIVFTIDGDAAQDFDDAVSLSHEGDKLILGVHIADVSHFVRSRSRIDTEAYARGTSVYLPWHTFHMLPTELSCGLCSLMPDADRLALSCEMEIENGMVKDYALFTSIIHSSARLTYNQVNKFFAGARDSGVPENIQPILTEMKALSKALARRKRERGAIDFDSSEVEFKLDASGMPVEITPRKQGTAESMIEEFMLLANQTVAAHMLKNDLGCVYRIHERPDYEDVHKLEELVQGLDINWNAGHNPEPRAFQQLIEMSRHSSSALLIQTSALRAMKKAKYSAKPVGHFGLALSDYCHFTSPIRRYPDLLVHRLLHYSLSKRTLSGSYARLAGSLPERASVCSACELNAAAAEREADNLLKCAYMMKHRGEVFEGVISGFSSWAVFVTLDNLCEGAAPFRSLNEYYTYADDGMAMRIVSDSGKALETGMKVSVRVKDTVLTEPRTYLELCGNY